MLITDGYGSQTAAITKKNRLKTKASILPEAAQISIDDQLSFLADVLFPSGGTLDGYVLFLENDDPGRTLVVMGINVVAEQSVAGASFSVSRNPVVTTDPLTNIVTPVVPPVNLNFGSGKQGLITFAAWDGTGTGIGGLVDATLFASRPIVAGENVIDADGTVVLQQGDSIGIKVNDGGTGQQMDARIAYHLVEEGA